jgi:putative pyruvate formate lyase activating enzyme
MQSCDLCPRCCHVNRLEGALGFCQTGSLPIVSSAFPHHGEEAPLRGWNGSGTIFFAHCNLTCEYCQNADISQGGEGQLFDAERLAAVMLQLQKRGCHNINFVSPSHVVAPIIAAVNIAAESGLRLPLVYNTGGYDSVEALALLDGIIDIYMPDMKYADNEIGKCYSGVSDYADVNRAAVKEMHRQVGDLKIDDDGITRRGLLVRHLVLPGGLAGTDEIAAFLAEEVSEETYINIMDQYRPAWKSLRKDEPSLNRRPTREEILRAKQSAAERGLRLG